MMGTLQKILFFLIVFFISSQFGPHFWPKFAYISGVRVDYLSPTVYLLDILIIGFTGVTLFREVRVIREIRVKWDSLFATALLFFGLDILVNIFLSKSPGAHVFGIIKVLEFSFFALAVAVFFKKVHIRYFIDTLCLSTIVSSILAIWQFISQSSVGGLWYFLGERSFNISTVGISTVNLDHQILRAYGAFPHPNVLSFILLATTVFIVPRIEYEKEKLEKIFLITTIIIAQVALVLTFSRTTIILAISFLIYAIYLKLKWNVRLVLGFALILGIFAILFLPGSFLLRGINFREELLGQSLTILSKNFYLGIGLNNFFVHQEPLVKEISPIAFQPVHNIFVLALLSLGLIGWEIVPVGAVRVFRAIRERMRDSKGEIKEFYKSIFLVLIAIGIVGMFDHFFLTVEQGQVMLTLIIGLSFAKLGNSK